MKIILLGSNGQLGNEFEKFLSQKESIELHSFTHGDLDILNLQALIETFKILNPDVVINCAAYTKVDKAEEEQDLTYKVNAIGAKNVAFASYNVGAKVVYFSTDYVFDGEKGKPYTEFDIPNPISIYGKSKFLGELFTKEFNSNHLILRISWLYGISGGNFVKAVIKLEKEKHPLRVVDDQIGCPTYTLDVVRQTSKLIEEQRVGLYHSSNEGIITWFSFTKEILSLLNLNTEVVPIKTEEYPTKATRPRYSVLENYLFNLENINIMRSWKDALRDFVKNNKEQLLNG